MVTPLTRMQATPTIDMREKRAPTRRQAAPSWMRLQRQQEAGNAADPDRRAELVQDLHHQQRRAVVEPRGGVRGQRRGGQFDRARATSSGAAGARWPRVNSRARDQRGSGGLHQAGDGEVARRARRRRDRSTVPTSTAVCSATVAASHTSSATRAPGGDARARRARCAAPAEPSRGASGRASKARNSTPPSAIDCASDGQARGRRSTGSRTDRSAAPRARARHGERHVAAGDVAVDRQHLPAHDIGAGRGECRGGVDARSGAPSGRSAAPPGCGPDASASGASGSRSIRLL